MGFLTRCQVGACCTYLLVLVPSPKAAFSYQMLLSAFSFILWFRINFILCHDILAAPGLPVPSCPPFFHPLPSEFDCDFLSVRLKKALFKVLNEQTFCFYFQVVAFCALFGGRASALSFIPLLTCFILGRGWKGKICLISKSLFFCNCPFSGFPVL